MARQSLKNAALAGVRWVMLARAFGEVLAFLAAVALARLVPPAEFGHATVALILVPLATILTYEGFASALVQWDSFEESHRRTAVLTSAVVGALLSGLTLVLARPVGAPLFGRETADLLRLASPVFLVASLGAVSRAMLWRRLDFRRMSVIEIGSTLAGAATAVVLALAGLDAKAVVLGGVAQTVAATVLLCASAPPPLPAWHGRAQREIAGFGMPAALAGLVHVLYTNVDYAILAARLTAHQTGIYWRAFNVGVLYQDKLGNVMIQMAFPVYSRTESRTELRELHERATRVLTLAIFPLLATLIALAPVAVPFVFGAAWRPAVVPTQILAVAGMIAVALTGYAQVMLAVGRPDVLLRFNVCMLFAYAGAVLLASSHGLVVIACTVVAVYVGILVGVYAFMLQPHVGLRLRRLLTGLAPACVGSLALVAVALPLRVRLDAAGAPAAATMAVAAAVGLAAYAAVVRVLFASAWRDLRVLAGRVAPPLRRRARRGVATVAVDGGS